MRNLYRLGSRAEYPIPTKSTSCSNYHSTTDIPNEIQLVAWSNKVPMVDFARFWYPKELSGCGGMALAAGPSFAWSAKTGQGFCMGSFDPTGSRSSAQREQSNP